MIFECEIFILHNSNWAMFLLLKNHHKCERERDGEERSGEGGGPNWT